MFLILPGPIAAEQSEKCEETTNVHVCPWELAFATGQGSLQQIIGSALPLNGDPFAAEHETTEAEELVRDRLDKLDTLPTLPKIVTNIMQLISDPRATIAQLQELLSSDPAVVLKVVQVANSAVFAGTGNKRWTLNEAIVRLGLRKVGAIAQQIALINSFVGPDDIKFDMERFWEHSVGCALMADKLVESGRLNLPSPVEFNEYWIGGLLHDSGKLVQGLFFSEWFERILRTMDSDSSSFHEAENELTGGMVSHEFIGELLIRKSSMPESLVRAVGLHHITGETPEPLTTILHLANNLTNEIGLGYTDQVSVDYSRAALKSVKIGSADLREIKEELRFAVVAEVRQLVKQCLN